MGASLLALAKFIYYFTDRELKYLHWKKEKIKTQSLTNR